MKGIVIIPTYNEAGNIERILPRVMNESKLDVLVVDDNSPDGTGGLVRENPEFGRRIFLLSRLEKNGLGRAYVAGFKYALENNYDFIVQMDADLSHNPSDLKRFVDALSNGADAACGSRYVDGVRVLDWDVKRLFLSICANIYARLATGVPLTDLTGGFNAYRAGVLNAVDLDRIHARGYMFQIEMKSTAYYGGFRVEEVPIIFIDRTVGETKLQGGIIYEAVFGCLMIRIRKWLRLLPLRGK